MTGGTDKATGLPFGVQYEAPAGYTSITPISTVVRNLEKKDTINTGSEATKVAESKVSLAIGLDSSVNLSTFDAYNAVSDINLINPAIAYQKAAASIALAVDIGSTGFVKLVEMIEKAGGTVGDDYKVKNQSDPFDTQKASKLIFEAIADTIISGDIKAGYLKTFGSESGHVRDVAIKLNAIVTPVAQEILGSHYSDYITAVENKANMIAAGVDRINKVASTSDLTRETAISGLIEVVKTQSVWQGDANRALEDSNPNNDWLTENYSLAENVTFKLVTTAGVPLEEGAEGYGSTDDNNQLNWGGYELKIDSLPVDTSKYTVNWYKVNFVEDGDDTYESVSAPSSGEINDSSFTTLALQSRIAGNVDGRKDKGLTFEIVSATDPNNIIQNKANSPVIRGTDGIIENSVVSKIFTYGALADGASVGVVVPTSYSISSITVDEG